MTDSATMWAKANASRAMDGPTEPAPRTIYTEKVDRMRERCGLDKAFHGLVPSGKQSARGTGRTTLMLLHALVAYDEGRPVAIVGRADLLQPAWLALFRASGVSERPYPMRFIGHDRGRDILDKMRRVSKATAVFIDHEAAHQLVEHALGDTVVMESP